MEILIGIDGGGTHATAVAVTKEGRVAAVVHGDGLNHHNFGVPLVRSRMEEMILSLKKQCGGADILGVCVGMSALDGPAGEETLAQFAQGALASVPLDLQSDAYIALVGFTKGAPGMIAICGTGSMLLMEEENGKHSVSGGWGYLLQDAGSGYTLARDALLAVIAQADGVGMPTALTQDALAWFHTATVRELIDAVYAPGFTPDRLASFARFVLVHAENESDPAACRILRANMERLAAQAVCMLEKAPTVRRIGLYGGIFGHSPKARQIFANAIRGQIPGVQIEQLDCQAELGAVIHLMMRRQLLSPQVIENMKTSYKEFCHECH